MQVHQELELKRKLTEQQWRKLLDYLHTSFGSGHELQQRNRFYDTPSQALKQQQMSLRLRQQNGRVLLTLKKQKHAESGFQHQEEHELWLNACALPALESSQQNPAHCLPVPLFATTIARHEPLKCLGGFDNLRHEFKRDNETICLDKTFYPNRIDYELEIETTNKELSCSFWQAVFTQLTIPVELQRKSKLHRFIECLSRTDQIA